MVREKTAVGGKGVGGVKLVESSKKAFES